MTVEEPSDEAGEAKPGRKRRRNPEGTRDELQRAALAEFAEHGYDGARIERIVERAECNIRMLYHYFGNKQGLYTAVLETAYADIRTKEAELNLETALPLESMVALLFFTFDYFEANPLFEGLLRAENMIHGRFVSQSAKVRDSAFPLMRTLTGLITSGQQQGLFRRDLDPIQIYVTMTALSRFHLANTYSLSALLDTNLADPEWRRARRQHAEYVLTAYLTAK